MPGGPEWGSIADWVGGVGGATGALSAASFYFMDRRREARAEKEKAQREKWRKRKIVEEAQSQLEQVRTIVKDCQNKDLKSPDFTSNHRLEATNKLRAVQRRMNELTSLAGDDPRLFGLIGETADLLLFLDLPQTTHHLWIAEAKSAVNLIDLRKERLQFFHY